MASLGDVGKSLSNGAVQRSYGWNGINKSPTSVSATGTSNIPYSFISLYRNAVLQDRSRSDSSGVWHFYDMDDSGSQVYTAAAFTQEGPTGELWTVEVVGSTATVTKLFEAQRATAIAWA